MCVFHSLPLHHTPGFMCPPPKSGDKNLHRKDTRRSSFTARPTFHPASLPHSPACGILSCVCVCLKFLLSFHDHPASTLVPGTLWFKLLAAIRVLTESVGSAWEFFCLWNWQWNLRNAWGGKSNLTTLLLMSSLFQTYKSKDCKTEHLKWCPIKCA